MRRNLKILNLFLMSLFLLTGCLSGSDNGSGGNQTNPQNPDIVENPSDPSGIFLSKTLTDFILTGTDSQNCEANKIDVVSSNSQSTSYSSIQEAINSANSGDQIVLGKGEFNEILDFSDKNGITLESSCKPQIKGIKFARSQNITIEGIRVNAYGTETHAIHFAHGTTDASDSITLDRIEVSEASYRRPAVWIGRKNTNILITSSYFHDNDRKAMRVARDVKPIEIRDSFFSSNKKIGLELRHSLDARIINNTFVDNGTKRVRDINGYGISRRENTKNDPTDVLLIDNRIVGNNGRPGLFSSDDVRGIPFLFDAADTGNVTTSGTETDFIGLFDDISAPLILVGVNSNETVSSPLYRLPVLIQDYSTVESKVYLNGKEVAYSPRFTFEPRITLVPGMNKSRIESQDSFGNLATPVEINVTLEGSSNTPLVRCNDNEIYRISKDLSEFSHTTIQEAVNAAADGDKIFVGNIQSSENVVLNNKRGLDLVTYCKAKVSSIEIHESERVKVDGFKVDPNFQSNGIVVHGRNLEFITIANNEVVNAKKRGIWLKNGNRDIRVVNNVIRNANRVGLAIRSGGPFTVEDNIITGSGRDGIELSTSIKVTLRNNKVIDNSKIKSDGFGIDLAGGREHSVSEDYKLFNNTFFMNNGKVIAGSSSKDIEWYQFIFDSLDTGNYTESGVESASTMALSDGVAPVISFGVPSGTTTNRAVFAVPVRVNDLTDTTNTVKLNGSTIDTQSFISFYAVVSLISGPNNVEITSTDRFGNSTTESISIILDGSGPQVISTTPANGDSIFSSDLFVNVSVEANEPILSATANGVTLSVSGNTAMGSLQFQNYGANTIEFLLEDFAGNSVASTANIFITNESVPPVISTSIVDNSVTNEENFNLDVDIQDQSDVNTEIVLNGDTVLETSEKSFNQPLVLIEGSNIIDVNAEDAAGNSSTLRRTVVLDKTPVTLAVSEPSEGSVLATRRPLVNITYSDSGTGVDVGSLVILINGADRTSEFSINQSNAQSNFQSDLEVGLNIINVSIDDNAGNSISINRNINLGIEAPTLSLIPNDGAVVNQRSITITANFSGEFINTNSFTLIVNGTNVTNSVFVNDSGATVQNSPDLLDGLNEIRASISNNFGQTTEVVSSVVYQQQQIVVNPPNPSDPPDTGSDGTANTNEDIIVAIEDPTSPIFGAMTLVPAGSVSSNDVEIQINLSSPDEVLDPEPVDLVPTVGELGPVIEYTSSEPFTDSVLIGIPFDRDAFLRSGLTEDDLVIVRYIETSNTFEMIDPYIVDIEKGLLFGSTEGFSRYYASWWGGGRRSRYYMRTELTNPRSCVSTLYGGKQCDVTERQDGNYSILGTIESNLFGSHDPEITCESCPAGTTTTFFPSFGGRYVYRLSFPSNGASLLDFRYEVRVSTRRRVERVVVRIVPPIPPRPTDPPPVPVCGQTGVMCNFLGNNTVGESDDGSVANISPISIGESWFRINDFETDNEGRFVWIEPFGNRTPPDFNIPLRLRRVEHDGTISTLRVIPLSSTQGQPVNDGTITDVEYSIYRGSTAIYIPIRQTQPDGSGGTSNFFNLWRYRTFDGSIRRIIQNEEDYKFTSYAAGPNDSIFYTANIEGFKERLIRFDTIPFERENLITLDSTLSPPDKISPDGSVVEGYEFDFVSDMKFFNNELYVIQDNANCIRKFDAQWILHTVAGICDIVVAPEGEDVDALSARLGRLQTMEIDQFGNIFFYEDFPTQRYRVVRADTGTVQTVAGGGSELLDFNNFPQFVKDIELPAVPGFPDLGPFTVDDDSNLYALGGNFVYRATNVLQDFVVPREPSSEPTDVPSTTINLVTVDLNTENILDILKNSQSDDGYFDFEEAYFGADGDDDSIRRLLATENALDLLVENDSNSSDVVEDALLWVANQEYSSTAMISKQLKVLTKYKDKLPLGSSVRQSIGALLNKLVSQFRPDFFGWGGDQYSVANNLDTGLAIEALGLVGKEFDADLGINLKMSNYVDTVRVTAGNQYNRDIARAYFGGFGFYESENAPIMLNTLAIVRGLLEFRNVNGNDSRIFDIDKLGDFNVLKSNIIPATINNAADFIIGSQRTNGSFGSIRETTEAMKVIDAILTSGVLISTSKSQRLQATFNGAVTYLNTQDLTVYDLGSIANFTDHFSSDRTILVDEDSAPDEDVDVASLPSNEIGDGRDGRLEAEGSFNINENSSNGRKSPDGVVVPVTSIVTQDTLQIGLTKEGDFTSGDEVLITSLQGANSSGLIEYRTVLSVDYGVSPAQVVLDSDISANFMTTDSMIMQRVPNYSAIDSPSSLTISASKWDGISGGIVAFRVSGSISEKVSINVDGLGFRGGRSAIETGQYSSEQGEGLISAGGRGIASLGQNGCGGGNATAPSFVGGGGSYGTSGSQQGSSLGAQNGDIFGQIDLSEIYLGCGGGSGSSASNQSSGSAGGDGGGIIIIFANIMNIDGISSILSANGSPGRDGVGNQMPEFGAGGGSGGSIYLNVVDLQLSSNGIQATGGSGSTGQSNQSGHMGGDGRIRINYQNLNGLAFPGSGQGANGVTISTPSAYAGGF